MIRRALIGVKARTLGEARILVEKLLQIQLQEGEGIYNGGLYYSLPLPDGSVRLRNNIDLDGGIDPADHLVEPNFPNHKFLLYLEPTDNLATRLKKLEDSEHFDLLRLD